MRAEYINIDSVIAGYQLRFTQGKEFFDEDLALLFAEDSLDKILTASALSNYVSHHTLTNGKAQLATNFKYPLQIIYRGVTSPRNFLSRNVITTSVKKFINKENTLTKSVDLKCNICYESIDDSDCDKICDCNNGHNGVRFIPYSTENLDSNFLVYQADVNITNYNHSDMNSQFMFIKPTTNYLFNLPSRLQGCQVPDLDRLIEYKIDNKIIEVNDHQNNYGEIIISYLGHKLDNQGRLLIPNVTEVFEAVLFAIASGLALKAYSATMTQVSERYWMNMTTIAERKLARARAVMKNVDADRVDTIMSNILHKTTNKNLDRVSMRDDRDNRNFDNLGFDHG